MLLGAFFLTPEESRRPAQSQRYNEASHSQSSFAANSAARVKARIMRVRVELNMRVPRVVLLVFFAVTASGRKEAFVPANDVSFTIATQHHRYQTGAQVIVRYEI